MTVENFTTSMTDAAFGSDDAASQAYETDGISIRLAQADPVPVDVGEAEPATPAAGFPAQVAPDADNVVHLPGGVSIDSIAVDGSNLVLVQPDGSRIVVLDAALDIPTFLIGDVEIAPEVLVAALEAAGIDVAAGPNGTFSVVGTGPDSASADLTVPPPGMGDAYDPIDLLPPTALEFAALEERELLAGFRANRGPSIDPDPDGGPSIPGTISISDKIVDEAGLPTGSRASDGSAIVDGVFQLSDPDGLSDISSITINGQTFTVAQLADKSITKVVVGNHGTLTIDGYDPATGKVSYTYELTSPVTSTQENNGANLEDNRDVFQLTVTDAGGLTGSATLNIDVRDDTPVAVGDGNLGSVAEGSASVVIGTVAGLLSNDGYGADGAHATTPISIATGSLGGTVAIDGGNLVYTPAANVGPAGDTETFVYTIMDGDGDTTTASFSVGITDTGVTMGAAPANLVADDDDVAGRDGNPGGTGDADQVLSGTISYTLGSDAIGSVTLSTAGNATTLQTLSGAAVVTAWVGNQLIGYVTGGNPATAADQVFTITVDTPTNTSAGYTMVLLQPVKHAAGDDENDTTPFTVTATVTDADGSTGTTSFTVTEVDPLGETVWRLG